MIQFCFDKDIQWDVSNLLKVCGDEVCVRVWVHLLTELQQKPAFLHINSTDS